MQKPETLKNAREAKNASREAKKILHIGFVRAVTSAATDILVRKVLKFNELLTGSRVAVHIDENDKALQAPISF